MSGYAKTQFPVSKSQSMTSLIPNLQSGLELKKTTQAELARKLGWSEAKLSRIANGKQKGVTMAQLKEIEAKLGVSLAYLMNIDDIAQNDGERELLMNYRVAPQRDQELAKAAVKPRR